VTAPDALDVHPANHEQWRAWDGTEGAYWAADADEFDRSVARYTGPFLDVAGIAPGEGVLDIGCGTGGTTRAAAGRAPGGAAVGIDLSAVMLDVARREADQAGLTSVRFVHGDAQVHPFDAGSFDVAISRSGAMFFADPVQAFRNIARALVPRGRLVLLVWQSASANEWVLRDRRRPRRRAAAAGTAAERTRALRAGTRTAYGPSCRTPDTRTSRSGRSPSRCGSDVMPTTMSRSSSDLWGGCSRTLMRTRGMARCATCGARRRDTSPTPASSSGRPPGWSAPAGRGELQSRAQAAGARQTGATSR
jgi:SAM-dependent methyltransferase